VATYTVTGGAGFIGSHLVDEQLRRGSTVRVVDDFSTGRRENLPASRRMEIIEGDIADPAVARRAAAGASIVLHQAAIPSVPRSVEDPAASHHANVDGTLQVLIAARDAGVKRVVFAGSSSVYGNAPVLPKREDMPPRPLSPYALQKLVGEEYCRLFTELYGLETVVTRYFNVFGPRQSPGSPYSGVISLFIDAMLAGQAPRIHGDGGQTRDFTYVDDVVQGVLLAAERPGVEGRVLNVAAGGRVSLLDLLHALQSILATTVDPILGPPRAGDVRDSVADISEARRLLGFAPKTTFVDGLRQTVEWFRTQAATSRQ
jgi:nucleoside-diphosphate-sugar epimerase